MRAKRTYPPHIRGAEFQVSAFLADPVELPCWRAPGGAMVAVQHLVAVDRAVGADVP